jgi:hypothetical protein
MDIELIEEILRQDWLSPQGATVLAGISYAWLRLLGERGAIATLDTPLGRLYNRADVERLRREREAAPPPRRGGRHVREP